MSTTCINTTSGNVTATSNSTLEGSVICYTDTVDLLLGALFSMCGLASILGNLVSLHLIRVWFTKSRRDPAAGASRLTYTLLLILTVADLVYGLFAVPLPVVTLLNNRQLPQLLLDNIGWICGVSGFLADGSMRCTVYVVMTLSVLRYTALYHPFKFQEYFASRRSPCCAFWIIFLLAVAHAAVPFAGKGYFYSSSVGSCHIVTPQTFPSIADNTTASGLYFLYFYFLTLSVAALVTLLTCCLVVYKLLSIKFNQANGYTPKKSTGVEYRVTAEESLAKLTLVVTVAFLACYSISILNSALRTMEEFGCFKTTDRTLSAYISVISGAMLAFNAAVNPIIYIHYTRHQKAQREQDIMRHRESIKSSTSAGNSRDTKTTVL